MSDVSNDREDPKPDGSWEEDTTGFAELGDLLRSEVRGDGSPTSAELRSAWSSFVEAARDLAQAVAATANDPEVRAAVKNAAQSLVETVGTAARDAATSATERVRSSAERVKRNDEEEGGAEVAEDGEAGGAEASGDSGEQEQAEESGNDPAE